MYLSKSALLPSAHLRILPTVTEMQTQVDRKCRTAEKKVDQLKLRFPVELKILCLLRVQPLTISTGNDEFK